MQPDSSISSPVPAMRRIFSEQYGNGPAPRAFFAPGRVNLIGEHTDYNGGHVLPCALTLGTYGLIRRRSGRTVRFYSMNVPETGIVELNTAGNADSWTAYPAGVIRALARRGLLPESGADLLFYGDIPMGSGLSSSASLEVLTALMLREVFDLPLSDTDLAKLAQYAENNYIGTSCGIMDPFASAMGKRDTAIFLDTKTLEYEYVPLRLRDAKIVIINSGVKHSLRDSAYNDRRRESAAALTMIRQYIGIDSLGDLTAEQFELYGTAITESVCRRRAKHAVLENARTIRAAGALRREDLDTFGKLMNESHISLRDDYEVSCPEIDLLTGLAWETPGVCGARITGGGFGGCTVNIVKDEALEDFIAVTGSEYEKQTGIRAGFYIAEAGSGAREFFES